MQQDRRKTKSSEPAAQARRGRKPTARKCRRLRQAPALAFGPQEALYRTLFEISPDGIVLTDTCGTILDVNQAICQTFGYSREELLGGNVCRFVPAEGLGQMETHLAALRAGQNLEHEEWNQRKNGERCLMRLNEKPLRLPDGRMGVLIVARDITRSRQGERIREVFLSLAASLSGTRAPREAARAIFAAADQLWKWDAATLDILSPQSGLIETVLACDVLAGQRQEIAPRTFGSKPSRRFRRILAHGAELHLRQPGDAPPSDTIPFGDCCRFSVSVMAVPVRTESQAVGVLSFQTYLPNAYTEEDLRTLQALADYGAAALVRIQAEAESHRLERQILQVSENEQARIGQDLHDGLCQELVSLAFDANVLKSALAAQHRPEAPLASRLTDNLDQAITECRQVSRGLFPVRLETEGLPSALEELAKAISARFQIRCRFVSPQPITVANSVMATHLYRIAQQAVTNAVQHSQARNVTLRLQVQAGGLRLSIEDDGIGLSAARQDQAKGLGLHIMNYRARTLGGTLQLGRGRQGGTTVVCILPRWESMPAVP
jgi:PAS domain S-box-containing protein